jgi:hypothetical protein
MYYYYNNTITCGRMDFAGNNEEVECSRRGLCNENTGICKCFKGFGSSNGTVDYLGSRFVSGIAVFSYVNVY